MTIAAYNHRGTVYYLQRTDQRDRLEIRMNPGRRSKLVQAVESRSEWREFVEDLKCTR